VQISVSGSLPIAISNPQAVMAAGEDPHCNGSPNRRVIVALFFGVKQRYFPRQNDRPG
jgi:hypothetical protein